MAGEADVLHSAENGNGPENGILTAAQKKKLKKKEREKAKKAEREALRQQLQQKELEREAASAAATAAANRHAHKPKDGDDVEIEYVSAPLELLLGELAPPVAELPKRPTSAAVDEGAGAVASTDANADDAPPAEENQKTMPAIQELQRIFEHFGTVEEVMGMGAATEERPVQGGGGGDNEGELANGATAPSAGAIAGSSGEGDAGGEQPAEAPATEQPLSRKKRRELCRPKVADLKQLCERPDVVEVWDVTAQDPELLVYIKSYRNTVPVPRHWSQKRHYLQGKRGLEKPPFKLPAFIEATGIGEMRQAYLEKAEAQKMKSKGRERMQPKMGKLDIDYQVLHDAFFRHQTKPALTGHGDLYYEGKEFESSAKHARPGVLSPALRAALNMNADSPPPWLVAMQRYGPPPSYPSLRIPGLNAPIPPGAQFGYHTGGWGKPPVDEYGQPIYGNVFAQGGISAVDDFEEGELLVANGVTHWGEFDVDAESSEEEEESSEEEEEEEEEEVEEEKTKERIGGAVVADGTASVISGIASSLPPGIETPVEVQLRKAAEAHAAAAPERPKELYTVLEQKQASVGGAGIVGSDHVYVVPGAGKGEEGEKMAPPIGAAAKQRLAALRKEAPTDLDISIDPGDLEALDDESLKDLYEAKVRERRAAAGREDFSDLVAAKAAGAGTQKRKAADKAGASKEKKFKF